MFDKSLICKGAAIAAALLFGATAVARTAAPVDTVAAAADSLRVAPRPAVPALAAADSADVRRPEMSRFVIIDGDTVWVAEPLEVLGSRVPTALPGAVRSVSVLEGRELKRLPGRSPAENLQTVPGVSVSQRQQYGVQSDLSIRGSSFEQVQVLLNGFDVGDPQTGHHLMNLPLGHQDVARMEVLPGHGSALYGGGAFGGTVNVLSRRPADFTGGEVAVTGGGNNTWGARGSLDYRLGPGTGSRFSLERFKTDGHDALQPDGSEAWGGNDADTWAGTGRITHEGHGGEWDLFGGYADRNFGALDYYAPFPSRERTRTLFLSGLNRRRVSDRLTLEPRVFFRRHRDEFVLLRDDPDVYTNDHVTRKGGAELRSLVVLNGDQVLALGVEGVYEDIDSRGLRGGTWGEALGNHVRRRASASMELDDHGGPVTWQMGGRVDVRPDHEPQFTGTQALSVAVADGVTIRGSIGNVYRLPTFTDLYYVSSSNVGNPDLDPETAWTWDAGFELAGGPFTGKAVYFERYEEGRIEWGWVAAEDHWLAMNIAEGTVRGVETQAGWRHARGHGVTVGWSWLENDMRVDEEFVGKYSLLMPRHLMTAQGTTVLPWDLALTTTGRYVIHNGTTGQFDHDLVDFRHYFVLDARLDWNGPKDFFASVAGTNLLDRIYGEVPGVQMPGPLVTGTVGKKF